MLIVALVIIGVLLLLVSIFSVSDNLIQIEAQKEGIDLKTNNLKIMPRWGELFGNKLPDYSAGDNFFRLKRGHNIKLVGAASDDVDPVNVNRYSIKPTDFRGIAPIPKVEVEVGQDVLAGQELFYDKSNPEIKYVAPVSGEVVEVRRGAKRSISHIVILADKEQQFKSMNPPSIEGPVDDIRNFLVGSGIWPLINQRPYDIVPDINSVPENIFISSFSTAPMATNSNLTAKGNDRHIQTGVDVLSKLTSGSVHFGMDGRKGNKPADALLNVKNAKKHWFDGKHPAGNVGVQIHHIKPITGSNVVWTLNLDTVILLGRIFNEGKYDTSRVISINGEPLSDRHHAQTYMGASINEIISGNIKDKNSRYRTVFGDVLSGKESGKDDFVSANCNQITVLEEGDYYELLGWLIPIKPRPSISRTYPNFIMPNMEFKANTNTHGEERAFVVTGQYESMLPMNIYPQHLMKAILTGEIEKMEGLGINELSEEDIALCEFACTSKVPLQQILRQGLDLMREQA